MNRLITTGLLALCLAMPLALADEGAYVGAGVVAACTDDESGDIGAACDLACEGTCVVTVADDVLAEGAVFSVCDWDGEVHSGCSEPVTGAYTHTSATGLVDVFVLVGTTGTVTTTPA